MVINWERLLPDLQEHYIGSIVLVGDSDATEGGVVKQVSKSNTAIIVMVENTWRRNSKRQPWLAHHRGNRPFSISPLVSGRKLIDDQIIVSPLRFMGTVLFVPTQHPDHRDLRNNFS